MALRLAIVAIGLAIVAVGAHFIRLALKERRELPDWPSTLGRVRWAKVTVRGNADARVRRFEAAYEYEVGGRRLRGQLCSYRARAWAELKRKYPPGREIEVFYDPRRPRRSRLDEPLGVSAGLTPGRLAFALIVIGIAVAGMGLMR